MKAYYAVSAPIVALGAVIQWYLASIFNESVRHGFDVVVLVFVAPGLLVDYGLRLGLGFDSTGMVWLSACLDVAVAVTIVFIIKTVWKSRSQPG